MYIMYIYIYILYKDLQTGGVRTVRGGIWPPVVTMETHVGGSKYRNSILVSSSCWWSLGDARRPITTRQHVLFLSKKRTDTNLHRTADAGSSLTDLPRPICEFGATRSLQLSQMVRNNAQRLFNGAHGACSPFCFKILSLPFTSFYRKPKKMTTIYACCIYRWCL